MNLYFRLDDSSPHWDFWQQAEIQINKWRFMKTARVSQWTPSINGLLWCINGMRELWYLCRDLGHEYILTRRVNQDPLENAIGQLRDACGENRQPTVPQFESAFTSMVITKLQDNPSAGRNCEQDDLSMEPLQDFVNKSIIEVKYFLRYVSKI